MIKFAKKIAQKSSCKYKHGAVIVKGSLVIHGINHRKTHPKYGSGFKGRIHAETDVIRKALNLGINIIHATMYVARHDGKNSKPCKYCMKMIQHFSMKVIHT